MKQIEISICWLTPPPLLQQIEYHNNFQQQKRLENCKCLSIHPSICLSVSLSNQLPACLRVSACILHLLWCYSIQCVLSADIFQILVANRFPVDSVCQMSFAGLGLGDSSYQKLNSHVIITIAIILLDGLCCRYNFVGKRLHRRL